MLIKKIGSAIMYIIAGIFVDAFARFFGFGYNGSDGVGFGFSNIIIISIVIGSLSYNLRIIKIKAQNKGMESEEKSVFNDTVKSKISFIVKSADFKIEFILHIIISVAYTLWIFVKYLIANGIEQFFTYKINILLIIIGITIIPLYMAAVDIFVWYKAYNKCYKTKEY